MRWGRSRVSGKTLRHSVTSSFARLDVPDASAAEARAWSVAERAFAEHRPQPRPRRGVVRAVVALATLAVAAGVVASPPGRAVVDRVREVVGVERAQPALFKLPTSGRMLVSSDAGVWVVEADGSKRLLGPYREAGWSPFGRFVVATRANELVALEPDGDVRWTLARPGARGARWTGSETDTRIAYVDASGVRVVAGDGTGDRLLATGSRGPLAWRPGNGHVVAHVTGNRITVQEADNGRVLWRATRDSAEPPTRVAWSADGQQLLVVAPHAVRVYSADGRVVGQDNPSAGTRDLDAIFLPGTHRLFVVRAHGTQSTVFDRATGRAVFSGTGTFGGILLSPDGRWLAIDWRTADQWVFVRTGSTRAIRAAAGVRTQFRGTPRFEDWCCPGE